MMAFARALVAATKVATIDGNQGPLQTALDDAIAAGMPPKCAAAVKARKLLRQLQKQAAAAVAAKQKAEEEQAKAEAAEAAREAERLAAEQEAERLAKEEAAKAAAAAAAAAEKKKAKEEAAAAKVDRMLCLYMFVSFTRHGF